MTTAQQLASHTDLKIKKIAVLTDFSQNANIAMRYAGALARVHEASLVLAHAYLPPSCAYAAPEQALVYQDFEDSLQNLENRLLEQTDAAYLQNIPCSVLLRVGAPSDLLEDLSDVDLIVSGTSGQTGIKKVLLGSTAEAILRSSNAPVLTVGPACQVSETEQPSFDAVLYATDFSASGEAALPYALFIAKEHNAELLLLHVIKDKDATSSFEQTMASVAPLEKLQKLVPENAGLRHKPVCLVGFGVPANVIVKEATNCHAKIIVTGSRRAGKFASISSHFSGRTAYSVAANAQCPVLTVRD